MKLLDTNVFIYAQGGPHPYREPCRAVLAGADPEAYGVDVLAFLPDPFPISRREVEGAADLVGTHPRLYPRDAIHAAVVLAYGLEGTVSTDRAFDRVAGLIRFDPIALSPEGG